MQLRPWARRARYETDRGRCVPGGAGGGCSRPRGRTGRRVGGWLGPTFSLESGGGTDFGINAGAGAILSFGVGDAPARLFAEARYHAIFADGTINPLPITVGIAFYGRR